MKFELMHELKKALIIFVRHPELGKVKTRLAASIGEEKALAIYLDLLQHTRTIALDVAADRFVFYADDIPEQDEWTSPFFTRRLQTGADLGNRMKKAFSDLLAQGYQQLVIIGSDCFELSASIVEQAFDSLDEHEVVIGPATDGGYYLLGMSKFYPALFDNKSWSTTTVFKDSVSDLLRENIPYKVLAKLTDVDTEEDWLSTRPAGL